MGLNLLIYHDSAVPMSMRLRLQEKYIVPMMRELLERFRKKRKRKKKGKGEGESGEIN